MGKTALIAIITTLWIVSLALAADVHLQVTVPDAWVSDTAAAIDWKFPGRPNNWGPKRWAEYQIRQWLRGIVAEYRTKDDADDILDAQGYVETLPADVPITTQSGD
jgi:hypothetical protein